MSEYKYLGLVYTTLDGRTVHYPGPDPWTPCGPDGKFPMSDIDLMNLRGLCILTLRKVERELDHRGLLTPVMTLKLEQE